MSSMQSEAVPRRMMFSAMHSFAASDPCRVTAPRWRIRGNGPWCRPQGTPRSTSTVRRPRIAASRATPAPVEPPPITSASVWRSASLSAEVDHKCHSEALRVSHQRIGRPSPEDEGRRRQWLHSGCRRGASPVPARGGDVGNNEPEGHKHEGGFSRRGSRRSSTTPSWRRATSPKARRSRNTGTRAPSPEGVEEVEHHPELDTKGDFAEGLARRTRRPALLPAGLPMSARLVDPVERLGDRLLPVRYVLRSPRPRPSAGSSACPRPSSARRSCLASRSRWRGRPRRRRPSAVVSATFGRMTGTPRMSAWNCISRSLYDHAAVDLERLERDAGVGVHGVQATSRVWNAVASSAARAMCPLLT